MLTRRLRHQAQKKHLVKKILFMAIVLLCACAAAWKYKYLSEEVLPVSTTIKIREVQHQVFELPKWRDILFLGIPRLITATMPPQVIDQHSESDTQQELRETLLFLTNIDINDMRSLLQAEIPVLAATRPATQTVSVRNLPNFPKFEAVTGLLGEKPVVGLYYTHTAESYVPNAGATHKPGGQRGDIVDVGEALTKRLAAYGIGTVQNTTVHDYPSFMKAYNASEITVKNMLAENPSLQMIFDIHRDAEKRENYITTVNGVQVARMMIVVTTGQPGLVQPHWQQNHAFAKLIDAKLNQRYPGLSRGIRMDDWRYNQHLHPRALLIEIGCQENSKEEAERGIELFGDIIAEIITESKQ